MCVALLLVFLLRVMRSFHVEPKTKFFAEIPHRSTHNNIWKKTKMYYWGTIGRNKKQKKTGNKLGKMLGKKLEILKMGGGNVAKWET